MPIEEVGNSNRMEKPGFQQRLNEVREKGIVVKQLTTDRHADSKTLERGWTTNRPSVSRLAFFEKH